MTGGTRRKIAIISEHASPLGMLGGADAGGQNVYVGQIAQRLAQRGHSVDVFTRRDRPDLPDVVPWGRRGRIIHLPAGPATFIRKEDLLPHMEEFIEHLLEYVASESPGYDLLHANFWMSALAAADVKRAHGIPFVVTFHALGKVRRQHQGEHDAFPDARFSIEERVVAEADRIIAECPQDEVDLITLYGADPACITMIPCGFDPEECQPVSREEARRRLGLPQQVPIVLQLGRLVPRKGVDNVVRAFPRVLEEHRDALLVVVGGESDEPDPSATPEIGRLQAIADEEGVLAHCHFAGRAGRDGIRDFYSAADVFVTTPWYEPFGITPVEAMACGVPVIGARVGGIQYTVCDGETGFLVEPRDPDALASRISLLLSNEALRHRMGQNGIRRVNELFTWDAVTESVASLYERVICEPDHGVIEEQVQRDVIANGFDALIEALCESRQRLTSDILLMTKLLSQCFRRGGKVLVCGNGGSAADAQHFATELVGRFKVPGRRGLPAVALNADGTLLTAWANDVGYEGVFARQVEALASPGDVLLGISTSGRSRNVVCAFEEARRLGLQTLGLLGGDGGEVLRLATSAIVVPSGDTQRIQEVHAVLIHLLCELVERELTSGEREVSLETAS
jgi:D-inositol-3-phosphate glycosyltransferase